MAKNLTKKQQVFVAEYLTDFNGARAYVAAGYSANGAEAGASRLLADVKVAAEIAKKQGKRLEKLEITADKVLAELAKLAFLDPRKFYNEDGSLKRITDLDDDTAACLAGMDVAELFDQDGPAGTVKKIKFADKGANLERLGRHLKLFTDKVEHSGKVTLEGLVCGDE